MIYLLAVAKPKADTKTKGENFNADLQNKALIFQQKNTQISEKKLAEKVVIF